MATYSSTNSVYSTEPREASGDGANVLMASGTILMVLGLFFDMPPLQLAGLLSAGVGAIGGFFYSSRTDNFEKKWGMPQFTSEDYRWNHEFAEKLTPWMKKELPNIQITDVYTSAGTLSISTKSPSMFETVKMEKKRDPETMQKNLYRAVDEIEEKFVERLEEKGNRQGQIDSGDWHARTTL